MNNNFNASMDLQSVESLYTFLMMRFFLFYNVKIRLIFSKIKLFSSLPSFSFLVKKRGKDNI